MKKLGKIKINPERIMKNEELMNFKGGVDGGSATYGCYRYGSMGGNCNTKITDLYAYDCESAFWTCNQVYEGGYVEGPGCYD